MLKKRLKVSKEKILVRGYEVTLYFDKDDGVYVAEAVDLPGCMAHGNTQEQAAKEIGLAIDEHKKVCALLRKKIAPPMKVYA